MESGQVTKEDIDKIQKKVSAILNEEFRASKDYIPQKRDWLASHWTGFKSPEQISRIRNTGYKVYSVNLFILFSLSLLFGFFYILNVTFCWGAITLVLLQCETRDFEECGKGNLNLPRELQASQRSEKSL